MNSSETKNLISNSFDVIPIITNDGESKSVIKIHPAPSKRIDNKATLEILNDDDDEKYVCSPTPPLVEDVSSNQEGEATLHQDMVSSSLSLLPRPKKPKISSVSISGSSSFLSSSSVSSSSNSSVSVSQSSSSSTSLLQERKSLLKKNYCFTYNNYDEDKEAKLQETLKKVCRYFVYGHEVAPTTNMRHLQGYLELKREKSFTALKKFFMNENKEFDTIHIEVANGNWKSNFDYCSKGQNIQVFGSPAQPGASKNRVNSEAIKDFFTAVRANASITDLLKIDTAKTLANVSNLEALKSYMGNVSARCLTEFKDFKFRDWQKDLFEELNDEPHDRKIIWFCDRKGGSGKSKFAKWLVVTKQFDEKVCLSFNGAARDLALLVNDPLVVVFDFKRTMEERINYQFIEQVKDGVVISPKYRTHVKVFPSPHVVVFSNFLPNIFAMSCDRWDVRLMEDKHGLIFIKELETEEIEENYSPKEKVIYNKMHQNERECTFFN